MKTIHNLPNGNALSRKSPRVSIGMPVYNAERFLRGALDSILCQSYSEFELIISDNASTDATESISREYAAKDGRIRYVRHPENRGAAFNFTAAMELAAADYFMWAAADDTRDSDFLRLAVKVMDADPDCGLVFSEYRVRNIETGACTSEMVAMYNTGKAWKRYLVRLLSPCPSLIYGLHRLSDLRKIPPADYDFFDVHLTHWYAVNSVVKVIPLPLYVAGIKGQFLPNGQRVSLPGSARSPGGSAPVKFDTTRFFAEERAMLFRKCPFVAAAGLYCLLQYFYFKNVRQLNAIIEQARTVG